MTGKKIDVQAFHGQLPANPFFTVFFDFVFYEGRKKIGNQNQRSRKKSKYPKEPFFPFHDLIFESVEANAPGISSRPVVEGNPSGFQSHPDGTADAVSTGTGHRGQYIVLLTPAQNPDQGHDEGLLVFDQVLLRQNQG